VFARACACWPTCIYILSRVLVTMDDVCVGIRIHLTVCAQNLLRRFTDHADNKLKIPWLTTSWDPSNCRSKTEECL
jgi:hypothetical protein